MFNKWLLSSGHFPFPVTLTLLHQCFCGLVAFVAMKLRLFECAAMDRRDYLQGVVPVGFLYALALWICFGVLIASFGEVNFSAVGTAIQVASLVFEATRLTLLQVLLQKKGYRFNPMTAMFYLSPITALFLFMLFIVRESSVVLVSIANVSPHLIFANCCCAFVLNIAVFLLVGKTSALTMNVSGVIKDWVIIVSSVYIFRSTLTRLNVLGFTIAFTGVLFYNFLRRKMKEQSQSKLGEKPQKGDEESQTLIQHKQRS